MPAATLGPARDGRMNDNRSMTDPDSATPTSGSRRSWLIPVAIVTGAVIVALAVFIASRTDDCDDWNDRIRTVFREAQLLLDEIQNASPGQEQLQDQASELQSRLRRTLAAQPDDCEIEEETAKEVSELTDELTR